MITKRASILVIDDSKHVLLVVCVLLEKLGFDVLRTTDPKEGFILAHSKQPTLIMTDIMMPEIDGYKLCQLLKAKEETRHIPVIMATAKNSRKDILRAREVGAANYLIKPVTQDVLRTKLAPELQRLGIALPWELQVTAAAATETPVESGGGRSDVLGSEDPDGKIQRILRKTKELLALPFAVSRALKVSEDDSSGARDLAKIISSDVAITAMILKKANSAFFGSNRKIMDAKEAIVRIGFNQTRSIVLGMSIIDFFKTNSKGKLFNRLEFWDHSLATAIIASLLAKRVGTAAQEDVFVTCLLHDVGKVILDESATAEFEEAVRRADEKGRPLWQVETELFGFSHMNLGLALVNRWQMPVAVQRVVSSHSDLVDIEKEADESIKRLMKICYYANVLSKALNFGNGGDRLIYDLTPQDALYLSMADGMPQDVLKSAFTDTNDFRSFLGMEKAAIPEDDPPESKKPVHYVPLPGTPVRTVDLFLRSLGYRVVLHSDVAAMTEAAADDLNSTVMFVEMTVPPDENTLNLCRRILQQNHALVLIGANDVFDVCKAQLASERLHFLTKPVHRELIRKYVTLYTGKSN